VTTSVTFCGGPLRSVRVVGVVTRNADEDDELRVGRALVPFDAAWIERGEIDVEIAGARATPRHAHALELAREGVPLN
jgi:hypothetical protein